MCGRYALTTPADVLARLFDAVNDPPAIEPRYNLAPTQRVPIVRETADGSSREIVLVRWGLLPFWAKDRAIANRLINCRAESAADKPAFRRAFRERRCLVPANGFYEWRRVDGASGGTKQPYFIHPAGTSPDEAADDRARPDSPADILAFAGLWESWRDAESDETVETCTILTTDANERVRPLHDRMPVILEPAEWDRWLDRDATDPDALRPLLDPAPAARLESYPVSRRVNSPRNEGPDLLREVDPDDAGDERGSAASDPASPGPTLFDAS